MADYGGVIGSGTAFHYLYEGRRFLVTNWHNVSGRDFVKKSFFDQKNKRIPLWLITKTAKWLEVESEPRQFGIFPTKLAIYQEPHGPFDPLWFEHPELSHGCDVIAIESPKPDNEPDFMHYPVNAISKMNIPVVPGHAAFVIGFPRSLSVGFGLPIWKSVYIASEPLYSVTIGGELSAFGAMNGGSTLPAFFLDGLTREGMSGSPVFSSFSGTWTVNDPYEELDPNDSEFWGRSDVALNHTAMQFSGVYSGRVSQNEQEAALGLCWRREVIDAILSAGKRGTTL